MQAFLNILTILAFFISAYNFIYQCTQNRRKVKIELRSILKPFEECETYILEYDIINKSRLPIAVIDIKIKVGSMSFGLERRTKEVRHVRSYKGVEVTAEEIINSRTPPVKLDGLMTETGLFIMHLVDSGYVLKLNRTYQCEIFTSRGVVKQNIFIDHLDDSL